MIFIPGTLYFKVAGNEKIPDSFAIWDFMNSAGAPGRIRTRDPLVRSQVLYPTELRAQLKTEILHMKIKKGKFF